MKKSLRLLLASAFLAVTIAGAAAPVKSTSIVPLSTAPLPECGPDGCVPNANVHLYTAPLPECGPDGCVPNAR